MNTQLCVSIPIKDCPVGFTPFCTTEGKDVRCYFQCDKQLLPLLKCDVNYFISLREVKNGKSMVTLRPSSRGEFEKILN